MVNKYFLGIDIETNSIGYAVTDKDYNLVKIKNKNIWGIRLFEESKTAAERRIFRSNRKRLQRRKERIKLLQSLFAEEISKIDESFFIRLKESKYHIEDKGYIYTLFNDKNFNDKDYHKKYETISHLKKELIENEEKADIRLIYLAIHNIIKNRGHFLFENLNETKPSFKYLFDDLNNYIYNRFEFSFDYDKYDDLEKIITSNISQKEKEKSLVNLFSVNKKNDKKKYLLLLALSNGKFDLYKLFEDENLKFDNKNLSLKLSEINNDTFDKINLSDEDKNIIILLKSIYDWIILENILKGNDYISFARVKIYEEHKRDLIKLKKFVKENFNDEKYNEIFKGKGKNGYANYVGVNKKSYIKKCSKEEFYTTLKTLLRNTSDKRSEEYLYINKKIEQGTFLCKQVNKDNSIIPYQINLFELEKILKNASKHYSFLLEKDSDNLTVIDKIISIFKFRIPYYVGPLNRHSPLSWFVKNSNEKIYPWNFEKVVNIEKSGEEFIRKMTNKCSYLPLEDVLAKNSLIYSEFMVLNEINNLRINDVKISLEIKKRIFNEIFCKNKKVTYKKIKDFLICNNYMKKEDILSGIDIDIKSSMSSYIDFKELLIDKYQNLDMVDNIISYIVIFGENKKVLESKITKKYGDILEETEIKECCKFKYSGWGILSKKLLTEITSVNKEIGKKLNIIDMLRETNNNFMEILSNKYNFMKSIKTINSLSQKDESILEKVNNLYVSPKIKRPIYQSLLIIKEIEKALKFPPEKIFIETAREKIDEKKLTKKRKQKLLNLYKNIKKEYIEIYNQLEQTEEKEFGKIKLYLYYLQLGKCMYTGKLIQLEELMNANIYDKDHIYPRSKIKDDSFDNLVLVDKRVNSAKTNDFPISNNIQEKMINFWYELKEKGFLTEEKFKRLTRKTPLSKKDLKILIYKQLLEVSQASKGVSKILQEIYPKTKIVYVKSSLVSDFRQKYDLLKCREVNDYHYAKDAYLNIVVGNVYNTQFSNRLYIKRLIDNKESFKKIFDYSVEDVWDKDKSLNIIKNTMYKNNILFTRYSDTKRGELFKQTLYPAGKNENLLPLKKELDVKKYGGYDSKSVAYFIIVEHINNKKNVISIEPVYMYNKLYYEKSSQKYCEDILNLVEPKILISKVKINTLFSLDGLYLHLSGKSADSLLFKPAMQLILSYEEEKYIKKMVNCVEKGEEYFIKSKCFILTQIEITLGKNIELYNKLFIKIKNSKYNVVFKNIYGYMQEAKERFENNLTLYEQCKILIEIIKILHCNATKGDFGILYNGKNKNVGGIQINKNNIFTKYSEIKLIYQSITGLYEQSIILKLKKNN
ncbi:MAG: type II CRISPR RNA-guided endonuclease Cas9 [Lachnospirales bacterium]